MSKIKWEAVDAAAESSAERVCKWRLDNGDYFTECESWLFGQDTDRGKLPANLNANRWCRFCGGRLEMEDAR